MHVAHVVEVGVAGMHEVGALRGNERRVGPAAGLDDAPVRHLRDAGGLPVDRPAWPMVVRGTMRRAGVDVAADAETELGVLVEDLARVGAGWAVREVSGEESLVLEDAG